MSVIWEEAVDGIFGVYLDGTQIRGGPEETGYCVRDQFFFFLVSACRYYNFYV
jgi:hypothetical protein